MKRQLGFALLIAGAFCCTVVCGSVADAAYINVSLDASDAVAVSETTVGGDSQVSSDFPGGENPGNSLDGDIGTKYLVFDGEANDGDASDSGIIVFFDSPVKVEAIRFGIANDAPERDPGTFTLEGSNSVSAADYGAVAVVSDAADWTAIVSDAAMTGIANPSDTFVDAFNSRSTFTDELPFERMADSFDNDTAYTAYRVLFPELRLPGNGIMQVAEIQLLAIPEPTSALLAGLAVVAGVARRR